MLATAATTALASPEFAAVTAASGVAAAIGDVAASGWVAAIVFEPLRAEPLPRAAEPSLATFDVSPLGHTSTMISAASTTASTATSVHARRRRDARGGAGAGAGYGASPAPAYGGRTSNGRWR